MDSYDPRWGDDSRERGEARDLARAGTDPREREQIDPRDVFIGPRQSATWQLTASTSTTATTTTPSAALKRARWPRWARSAWSPRATSATSSIESLDPRQGELWHLRESGLVQTVRLDRDTTVVTLTKEGRDLLESRRRDDADSPDRQAFHDGIQKPRELKHDAEVYRAYLEEADASATRARTSTASSWRTS